MEFYSKICHFLGQILLEKDLSGRLTMTNDTTQDKIAQDNEQGATNDNSCKTIQQILTDITETLEKQSMISDSPKTVEQLEELRKLISELKSKS